MSTILKLIDKMQYIDLHGGGSGRGFPGQGRVSNAEGHRTVGYSRTVELFVTAWGKCGDNWDRCGTSGRPETGVGS